jgi:hypothetical protein
LIGGDEVFIPIEKCTTAPGLRLCRETILAACCRGKIRYLSDGREIRVNTSDVREFKERQELEAREEEAYLAEI